MPAPTSSRDVTMIEQLNARYAWALDGLVTDPAAAWADVFCPDGHVAVSTADGQVVAEATGSAALAALWRSFPDVATTRHWFGNLTIEIDGAAARMRAYVAAISIKSAPAVWTRTGIYSDRLVRDENGWRFRERLLTLDPASRI